jgi:hypothetical protein
MSPSVESLIGLDLIVESKLSTSEGGFKYLWRRFWLGVKVGRLFAHVIVKLFAAGLDWGVKVLVPVESKVVGLSVVAILGRSEGGLEGGMKEGNKSSGGGVTESNQFVASG